MAEQIITIKVTWEFNQWEEAGLPIPGDIDFESCIDRYLNHYYGNDKPITTFVQTLNVGEVKYDPNEGPDPLPRGIQ